MLNDLYANWPNCPTTHIVADRAWDDKEAIRDCALRFGIHLIVGRAAPSARREPTALPAVDHPHIGGFDGLGNAYCRHHGVVMRRAGYDFLGPVRRAKLGLRPGEPAPEGAFRLRFECPVAGCPGAKKPHLYMRHDWAALSAYPHSIDGGRADLHAERLALYARRNSYAEGLFSSLKLGHKLALDGADRTHTPNEATLATLHSLALLLRTALVTAHERIAQGASAEPPPDLIAALAVAR